eukprot:jgi/Picsp_1/4348/NSC_01854-R1_hypothetical protein CHLNCDRAFT_138304 [Chlorella variabilis]
MGTVRKSGVVFGELEEGSNQSTERDAEWRKPVKRFDFRYIGSKEGNYKDNKGFLHDESERYYSDGESNAARLESLKEYEELKNTLLSRTWKFGALFSVYLILTVSSDAAVFELIGSVIGYGYLLLLIREIDSISAETEAPMLAAEQIEPNFMRSLTKIGIGYRYSLNPRLLLLIGLACSCAAWNALQPAGQHIGLVEEGCLLGGFLGYKISLFLKVYDDLKPKRLTEEELMRASRPVLEDLEDVTMDFRKKDPQ